MIRIVYSSEAKADLGRERDYYAAIRHELGARFLSAVEQAVLSLATRPLAMQIIQDEIRRWPVKGFQHGVLYRVDAQSVFILAVFHPRQHPARWQKRAKGAQE